MGGMYTAKPSATADNGYPPGWPANWAWPGPWPPGYIPALSFLADGPDSVAPGETADADDCEFKLVDQEEYRTTDPSEKIVVTARLNSTGALIGIRETGDPDFVYDLEYEYGELSGSFYGVSQTFNFQTSAANAGDKVKLTAESRPLGQDTITQVMLIPIIASGDWNATYKVTVTYADPPPPASPWLYYRYWGDASMVQKDDTPEPQANISGSLEQKFSRLYSNRAAGIGEADAAVFGCYSWEYPTGTPHEDYYLGQSSGEKEWILRCHTPDGVDVFEAVFEALSFTQYSGTWDLEFKVYQGDVLKSTTTKQMVKAVGEAVPEFIWLEWDSGDGSVTIITA